MLLPRRDESPYQKNSSTSNLTTSTQRLFESNVTVEINGDVTSAATIIEDWCNAVVTEVSTVTAGLQFDPDFVYSTASLRYPVNVDFSHLKNYNATNIRKSHLNLASEAAMAFDSSSNGKWLTPNESRAILRSE